MIRGDEGLVLFRGDAVEGLEPVGVVGGPEIERPSLHTCRDMVGDGLVQRRTLLDGLVDGTAGVLVEVYATTLHYAPCHADASKGFKVMVALPKGTNVGKPEMGGKSAEDKYLTATNKWLLAHPESAEAKSGAAIGLKGENIDIAAFI